MADRVAQGIKGAQAVRWRSEPCSAELVVIGGHRASGAAVGRTFACQRPQRSKGDQRIAHHHRWEGEIDGQQVTVTWVGGDPR